MVLLENHCAVWDFTQNRMRYKTVLILVLPIRPIAPQTRHSPSFAPSIDVSIMISDQKASMELCKSEGTYVPHWYSTVQLLWLPPGKSQMIVLPFTIDAIVTWKSWDTATVGHFQVPAFIMRESLSLSRFLFWILLLKNQGKRAKYWSGFVRKEPCSQQTGPAGISLSLSPDQ